MGNTASTHNVHLEDVSSELNAFYHLQKLHRTGKRQQQQLQWTHSLPHMMATAADCETSSVAPASALAQIKVLPQLSERLRLRTTTNGAILHSGGTITGRRDQHQKPETHKPLALQQRSRTFIDESKATWNGNEAQQVPTSMPAFRRAQTVLHLDFSSSYRNNVSLNSSNSKRRNKSNSNAVHNNKCSDSTADHKHRIKSPPLLPVPQAKTLKLTLSSQSRSGTVSAEANNAVKLNKYNKKRKAPAVPLIATTRSTIITKNPTAPAAATVPATSTINRVPNMKFFAALTKATATTTALSDTKTATKEFLRKTRLFRTNAVKSSNIQQQQQQQSSFHHQPLRQLQQQHQSSRNAIPKPNAALLKLAPYRREKSSDAILIRQLSQLPRKALTRTLSGCGAGKCKSEIAPPIATTAPQASIQASRSEEVGAVTISKTSQLNRTFYFGMGTVSGRQDEVNAEVALTTTPVAISITKPATKGEVLSAAMAANSAASAAAAINSYKLSMSPEAKAIVDNGLLVHVRPTLPRRQLDTPSFSPVTAWRTLMEEEQRLHKQNISNLSTYLSVGPSKNKFDLLPHIKVDDTNNAGVTALNESPIQLHKVEGQTTLLFSAQRSTTAQLAATWTPQQDVEEDDENEADYGDDNHEDVNDDDDHEYYDRTNDLEKKRVNGKPDGYDVENGRGKSPDDKDEIDLVDIAVATVTHYSGHRNCCKDVEMQHQTAAEGKLKEQIAASTKSPNHSAAQTASGMHVFSLSLPRDAHIQAHLKNRLHSTAVGLRKDAMCSFSSLQKLKYNSNAIGRCCCLEMSPARNLLGDTDKEFAVIVADATSQCPVHSRHSNANYRSDNWMLHKTNSTSSLAIASAVRYHQHALAKDAALVATARPTGDTLPYVEPVSLTYLIAGKHVMYLPGKQEHKSKNYDRHDTYSTANKRSARTANPNQKRDDEAMQQQRPLLKQQQQKRQRRTRPVRESLQDADAEDKHRHMTCGGTSNTDKSQHFSFQSTVRLLEKRRLAEKLAKSAEIREEQRKSELEAMKRVEEDFQRKRASEKENIRNQLRLYFSGADECSDVTWQGQPQYMSLPVFSKKRGQDQLQPHYQRQQQHRHDSNNNIACRDDPDGAVSPPLPPSYIVAMRLI